MADPNTNVSPLDHERLLRVVGEFEAELAKLDPDSVQAQQLRADVALLKQHLSADEPQPAKVGDAWQSLRDNVENQVLRDSPYLSEIGRILGLV